MGIQVNHLCKRFHETLILDDVNLTVETGELVALLGPSGSGKTTLLRTIAGLEFADSGTIFLEGKETQNKHAKERQIGFVFQHYALFKHMTVFENVAFGLRVQHRKVRLPASHINHKVKSLLGLMHLESYSEHYPYQLSGGQQQRVALVRALAVDPKVLLLDEPFGALDANIRKELCRWLRMLHDELKISSIFVTHDQEEAMEVSDRIAIMNKGKIEQIGTPVDVWKHPKNHFVYAFLGEYNVFYAREDANGVLHLVEQEATERQDIVKIYSRPFETNISKTPPIETHLSGRVSHTNAAGAMAKIEVKTKNNKVIYVEMDMRDYEAHNFARGDDVFVWP